MVMELLHKPDEELLDANQDVVNSIDQSVLHEAIERKIRKRTSIRMKFY